MDEKLKRLVHYICWKVEDTSKLGATKLNKILWYSDTIAYRLYGEPITEATYVKQKNGPVPKHILKALSQLESEKKIAIREREYFGYQKREFIALQAPDVAAFSEREMKIVSDVVEGVCDHHTGASISELSHDQIWEAAAMGEELPMYATLGAVEGQYTTETLAWADSVLKTLEAIPSRVA